MSVKKNYIYTLVYQLITIAFPLITIPYISRVLGSRGVGTYSYTNSLVQYFILFSMLGIAIYGSKMIAIYRDNKEELSRTFLSIYILQLIMTTFSLIVYFLFVNLGMFEHKTIMYIQAISLLSCLVDCSWFFSGLEQFKQIVTRNIVVKMVSMILLFLCVKNSADLPIYTIIMTGTTLIGQMVLWIGMKERIKFVPIKYTQIMEHFKPTVTYFIPQVAVQIYFVLNKTMIGVFSTESEVGVFDYADKLLKVCLAFITSLGTVMLPKMAYIFSKGDQKKIKSYLFNSLDFSTLIAIPIMFGLAGISFELIPWYLGSEFDRSIDVLLVISPTIFFMAWSGIFGTQYLLPLGKMKIYTVSVYVGAIVNLAFNLILIKPFGSVGASVGTFFAELAVMLVQLVSIREQIDFNKILLKTMDYLLAGVVMLILVRLIGSYMGPKIITTILQISIGVVTYFVIVILIEYIKKDGLVINELKTIFSLLKSKKAK